MQYFKFVNWRIRGFVFDVTNRLHNLFIRSNTQSWIFEFWIYFMTFAVCFDLLICIFVLLSSVSHKYNNLVLAEFSNFRIGNRAWFLFQVSPVLNTILKRSDKNCEVKQFSSLLSLFEWALNWNFSAKSQEWSSKKHFWKPKQEMD